MYKKFSLISELLYYHTCIKTQNRIFFTILSNFSLTPIPRRLFQLFLFFPEDALSLNNSVFYDRTLAIKIEKRCLHLYLQIREIDVKSGPSWPPSQSNLLQVQWFNGWRLQFGDSRRKLVAKLVDGPHDAFIDVRIALLARFYVGRCKSRCVD